MKNQSSPQKQPRRKVRIFVAVCTCISARSRQIAARETWMAHKVSGIECKFFIGNATPIFEEDDTLAFPVNDDYAHLPEKGMAVLRYAVENYDFDWFFKCDDDTYLAMDRLDSVADPEYDLIGDVSVAVRGAPSGGAGYFLSRRVAEKIVAVADEVPATGAEDVIFGELVSKLGGKLKADRRLGMCATPYPSENNEMVSAHWCSPEMLRSIELFLHEKPVAVCSAKHPFWEDEILFYENGLFRRKAEGSCGKYLFNGSELSLQWFHWDAEKLLRDGACFSKDAFSLKKRFGEIPIRDQKPKSKARGKRCKMNFAVCLPSYRRFEDLQRQIYAMMDQSYEHFHLFVAVKGMPESLFHAFLLPQFRKFIEAGRLTMRYFPNKNQLSNIIDTVRGLDTSAYDFFLKIDDDDFYCRDYLKTINQFYSEACPKNFSCYFNDWTLSLNKIDGVPVAKATFSQIFGDSMVLTRDVWKQAMECEANPALIETFTRRYLSGNATRGIGWTEDMFLHMLMREYGCKNIAEFVQAQKIYPFILFQHSNASVMRGGLVPAAFRARNTTVSTNESLFENVIELRHSAWCDVFIFCDGEGYRASQPDETATVLEFTGERIVLKWTRWGVECFERQANGVYVARRAPQVVDEK